MAGTTHNEDGVTARHGLPLLYPGQAHKEVTHNQAISQIDLLLNIAVEAVADAPDSLSVEPGQCWLVSAQAQGEWAQYTNHIAAFQENGWIYLPPREGMIVYAASLASRMVFQQGQWTSALGFTTPVAGAVVDQQARDAILLLATTLTNFGLIRSA